MTNAEAKELLNKVVSWHLKSPSVKNLQTAEEKAYKIARNCFAGGGTETCNLITYYDDLDGAILEVIKE